MNPGGPGWNDPPKLSYEIHAHTTSRKNLLTKRVGLQDLKIPLGSDIKNKNVASSDPSLPPCNPVVDERGKKGISDLLSKESLPPGGCEGASSPPSRPTQSAAPLGFDQIVLENSNERISEKFLDPTNIYSVSPSLSIPTVLNPLGHPPDSNDKEVVQINQKEDVNDQDDIDADNLDVIRELKLIIERCEAAKIFSKPVGGNILKKIEILERKLNDLPIEVRSRMISLTKFLMMKKYDKAWDVHVSLMCDYSSVVIQWMVGVKRLISEAKKL